jgi:hypothetical protein
MYLLDYTMKLLISLGRMYSVKNGENRQDLATYKDRCKPSPRSQQQR